MLLAPLEHNIELFFLCFGIVAILLAHRLSLPVALNALREGLPIGIAVIVAGAAFALGRGKLERAIGWLSRHISPAILTAAATFVIATLASVITVIVAALIFSELLGLLRLSGRRRDATAVSGCFAIGLGAALTPVGEPLATIAVSTLRLKFLGLAQLLGLYVLPGMAICSAVAGFFVSRPREERGMAERMAGERPLTFLVQGLKVYGFVTGLVLISEAFAPLARQYVTLLGPAALYWANTVSAVADNATLVAIELHGMTLMRAREALIALLLAGGMLIPGNVPNIICAGKLRIGSREWARVGLPMGAVLLASYFAVLRAMG